MLETELLHEVEPAPEITAIRERVVVSPCAGRFYPLSPEVFTTEGEWVEPGQVIGEVRAGTSLEPVRSSFRGWVMGVLGLEGQPVREGDALFWIWGC